jgi:hypothetical protein
MIISERQTQHKQTTNHDPHAIKFWSSPEFSPDAGSYPNWVAGGKVLDISTNNCIVEVSAKPTRIDSFMKLISPFGISESARTGKYFYFYFLEIVPQQVC